MQDRSQSSPLLVWLDDGISDPTLVGSKAFTLSQLNARGIPTPTACCLTVAAWKRFEEDNNISLANLLQEAANDQIVSIRAQISSAALPTEIQSCLSVAWTRLESKSSWKPLRVAVRSSGISEDLPSASFAGQYATFLNVTDLKALESAVKGCWASLISDRAIAYRGTRGGSASWDMAVIIQELIPATAAGTGFSANPITGRRDELHIDATLGLGEAVVAGKVTPDHFFLRTSGDKHILSGQKIAHKTKMVMPADKGGTSTVPVDGTLTNAPSLSCDEVLNLASTIQRLTQLFGTPQDVEWAIADSELYILQSRPITALPALVDQGIDWVFIVKKRLSWLTEMMQVEGIGGEYYKASLDLDFEFRNAKMVRFYEYLDSRELSLLSSLLDREQERDSQFLDKLARRSYTRCNELSLFMDKIEMLHYEHLGTGELQKTFEDFVQRMLMLIPVIYTEPTLENRILEFLRERLPGAEETTINDHFVTLTNTSKDLTILKEQRSLLKIAAAIQDQPKLARLVIENSSGIMQHLPAEITWALQEHEREFAWINTDDLYGHPWTQSEFLDACRFFRRWVLGLIGRLRI